MTGSDRLSRHVALVGPLAAKAALSIQLSDRLDRPFFVLDEEPAPEQLARRGVGGLLRRDDAPAARVLQAERALAALRGAPPAIVSLPDSALALPQVREALRERALTVLVDTRARVEAADVRTQDVDEVVLTLLGIRIERGARPAGGTLIADELVLRLHPLEHDAMHTVDGKSPAEAERLWRELALGRGDTIVAYGGGTTIDLAGFVAATYRRGVRWIAVPTTIVAQVDAAIGGRTALDLPEGKDLVGTFHYPDEVLIDTGFLETLPDEERRSGMAAVVKAGLLAGRPLWELPEEQMIRACAAFKASVCLRAPYGGGRRELLELGLPFAHALETASLYTLRHGDALALGLLAALRLSGRPTDVVEEVLDPRRVHVDRARAWAALRRDTGTDGGGVRLVLFDGEEARPVEVPEDEARAALDALIAG